MMTGTDFLIGIGVLVVISVIASIYLVKHPKKPWEQRPLSEGEKATCKHLDEMGTDPSWHSIEGNIYHDMF